MGYQVIFAPQALESLEQIVSRIAQDNPDLARRFGMRLVNQAEILTDFPELGVPYEKRPGVRRLLCQPYFIYDRVQNEQRVIEVMDYWHAARREPEL